MKYNYNFSLNINFIYSSRQQMYDLLEGWLRHKSDIVNFEAAKAICNIKDVTIKELYPAVNGNIITLFFVNLFNHNKRMNLGHPPIFHFWVFEYSSTSAISFVSKVHTSFCRHSYS